jgi:anti-sigma factor RsiW
MTDSGHLTSGLLIRALDGELDVSQRLALEQHLSVCEQCLSEFERWADLSSKVNRSIETIAIRAPGEARAALASKLIQEARPLSPKVRALRWLWPVLR